MKEDKTRESHPSFGMVSWSRVSVGGGGVELFGSELRHQQLVEITISAGTRTRSLSQDWYSEDSMVARVMMSSAQFSEFITTPNASSVPCTFVFRADHEGAVPDYPGHPGAEALAKDEFKKSVRASMQRAQDLADKATATLKSGNLKAGDRKELLHDIQQLMQQVKSNLPFVADQFGEAMEKTVTAGRQELEAFASETVRRHGLEALGSKVPTLGWNDDGARETLVDDMEQAREDDKVVDTDPYLDGIMDRTQNEEQDNE